MEEICEQAQRVCDVCGQEGHLREGGWLRVQCDEHARLRYEGEPPDYPIREPGPGAVRCSDLGEPPRSFDDLRSDLYEQRYEIAKRREALDFAADFAAAGESYSTADSEGRVVVHGPDVTRCVHNGGLGWSHPGYAVEEIVPHACCGERAHCPQVDRAVIQMARDGERRATEILEAYHIGRAPWSATVTALVGDWVEPVHAPNPTAEGSIGGTLSGVEEAVLDGHITRDQATQIYRAREEHRRS